MKAIALALSMILILVPLAGCSGTDGEVNVDLTTEEIQELIDDNIDDFLNNTTITVNQESHNNYTTIEAQSLLKSKSGLMTGIESSDHSYGAGLLVNGEKLANDGTPSVTDVGGAAICVATGTTTEGHIQDFISDWDTSWGATPTAYVADDATAARAAFVGGECDIFAGVGSALEAYKWQLDGEGGSQECAMKQTDGTTCADLWIVESIYYDGTTNSHTSVRNSISIIIDQSSDEMITGLSYILAEVTLFATCKEDTTDCNDIEQILSPSSSTYGMETTCSHNVTFSWHASTTIGNQDPRFQGHGLDCMHSLNLHVSILNASIQGYDSGVHELHWGDWVYSVIWESIPLQKSD